MFQNRPSVNSTHGVISIGIIGIFEDIEVAVVEDLVRESRSLSGIRNLRLDLPSESVSELSFLGRWNEA